jgi:hypothetical protein
MTEKKKREKVVAEITAAHLSEFAAEIGRTMNQEEAIAFLNSEGRAYEMWKRMMQAGEEYLRSTLRNQSRFVIAPAASNPETRRLLV